MAWELLDLRSFTIQPPEAPAWQLLDVYSFSIAPPEAPAWQLLDAVSFTIRLPVMPPEIPPPPEKKEFPWLPVALIGGGAVIAGVALTKTKKRKSS